MPLELKVLIRGAGEMASGVAHRLHRCHFRVIMTEIPEPLCIRRRVSFSEAVFEGEQEVEGVRAVLISDPREAEEVWRQDAIPVIIDPEARSREVIMPDVVVDAILAKRNIGTRRDFAPLVIGLGPGFKAGEDVDVVIETNRGHNLGRVIYRGEAEPDTGVPGVIAGVSAERVLRAPADGIFRPVKEIGDLVKAGEVVAWVGESPMKTAIDGVIRGLLREGTRVKKGLKSGDVDPRGQRENCYTISDKARTISGGVLEAILAHFNR
ncbi:MAG: EF2563 family selenium-dependent molybdenum hydroxylase system protein [Deltaproteobacteria bacterium]|nr:MAG: EF2563 family selenium-dependent molybdenum hydroxylase system protein [Deltaproteobacteria bacterium]